MIYPTFGGLPDSARKIAIGRRYLYLLAVFVVSLAVAPGAGVASQKPANAANGLYPVLDCVTYDRANNFVTAY